MDEMTGYMDVDLNGGCCICSKRNGEVELGLLGGVIDGHPFRICCRCLTVLVKMTYDGVTQDSGMAKELTTLHMSMFLQSRMTLPSIAELQSL